MACSNGIRQRSMRSAVISWNLARVSVLVEVQRPLGGGR